MFVPQVALIWIRSITILLRIVAHALRHIHTIELMAASQSLIGKAAASSPVLLPEVVEILRALLAQTTAGEEGSAQQALPEPNHEEQTTGETTTHNDAERKKGNPERVKQYLADHSDAKVRDAATALGISVSTTNKWTQAFASQLLPLQRPWHLQSQYQMLSFKLPIFRTDILRQSWRGCTTQDEKVLFQKSSQYRKDLCSMLQAVPSLSQG